METIEYKGYTINLTQDEYPFNPREKFDHLGTMACFHSRYLLGDKDHGLSIEECNEIQTDSNYISLTLYLYDHSGLTMNTTGFACPWDSGKVGIIFVEKSKALQEFGPEDDGFYKRVFDCLRAEVEEYDTYLRGDVWAYEVTRNDANLDSCSGFYGYEYAIESAKEFIEWERSNNVVTC